MQLSVLTSPLLNWLSLQCVIPLRKGASLICVVNMDLIGVWNGNPFQKHESPQADEMKQSEIVILSCLLPLWLFLPGNDILWLSCQLPASKLTQLVWFQRWLHPCATLWSLPCSCCGWTNTVSHLLLLCVSCKCLSLLQTRYRNKAHFTIGNGEVEHSRDVRKICTSVQMILFSYL